MSLSWSRGKFSFVLTPPNSIALFTLIRTSEWVSVFCRSYIQNKFVVPLQSGNTMFLIRFMISLTSPNFALFQSILFLSSFFHPKSEQGLTKLIIASCGLGWGLCWLP